MSSVAVVSMPGAEAPALPRAGAFDAVLRLSLAHDAVGPQAGKAAVEMAERAGADWMVLLGPGEALRDDAFELVAPGLRRYDAIFGSAHVRGSPQAVAKLTRLAFDTPDRLPHALLNWWMPDAHLVRTEVAAHTIGRIDVGAGTDPRLDYLFDLWDTARCLKSAQPLLDLDSEPRPLDASGRMQVLERLARHPVFLPVVHGDVVYELPYTGMNAGIEREQSRGLFFEAMELEELRKMVGPGARVVDVGANTGNHAIFFAGPMKAQSVLVLEPMPAAIAALRAGVERNGLSNIDLSRLGIGISDVAGRARFVRSEKGGLGATGLAPDPEGEIGVATLDSMVSDRVDLLKIDVEGMEMSVLAGSRQLIERSRPLIFIEVANDNTPALTAWLDGARYDVVRIFPDKGHANYLLAPEAGR
ncbi:FkbM family methyltransferase [Mesorhizobium marinum]|uniref:FkbM family methyltransferase n=1 Tax=Mesorhizobium marinum TaxID=3228790 RepID=UPI0034665172